MFVVSRIITLIEQVKGQEPPRPRSIDGAAYDAHLKHLADEGNTGPALGSGDVQRIPGLAVTSEQG